MLTNDDIQRLLASIDEPVESISEIFENLKLADNHYVSYAPMEEDIETKNDEWEGHYFEGLGFNLETQCNKISHFSFHLKFSEYYKRYGYEKLYSGSLPFGLSLKMTKTDVHQLLGTPLKAKENREQYHVNNRLILGLLYDDGNEWLRVASVGSMKVFSSEELYPSRWSEVYQSLYNLEQADVNTEE
jgi:hypothetical protein